jgi:hypothetical protein
LAVWLTTDKEIYGFADETRIHLCLKNITMAPEYIYGTIDWGETASLSIWVRDADSQRDVAASFIADAPTPPPMSVSAFSQIPAVQCYSVDLAVALSELNVTHTGRYEVVVSYHSPIPRSMSFGLPIVSRENGEFQSNRISIAVR